ncbi:MAG TPA: DNA polymerase I [Pantanalinema sp.]
MTATPLAVAATAKSEGQRRRLVLIDGHAIAYRAHFALMRMGLATREGVPTWAVYGFTKTILDVIAKHKPDLMAVAFDRKAKTFRHQESEDYKAHRKPMPDDLIVQMDVIRRVVRAFDLPIYELDGYEADDVIGTIAKAAAGKGYEVLIVTGDRDAFQLVDAHINVLWAKSGSELIRVDEAKVASEFDGLRPFQIIEYKGLAGDSSDNIKGVQGIGDKTAKKLLAEFETVENLLSNLDKLDNAKLRAKLAENVEAARQSLRLATIDTRVPIEGFDWEHCEMRLPDLSVLIQCLTELEFKSIVRDLPKILADFTGGERAADMGAAVAVETQERALDLKLTVVTRPEQLEALVTALAHQALVAFDTETDSLDALSANLVGISLAFGSAIATEAESYYLPVGHLEGEQLPLEAVTGALKPFFEDPARAKTAHNAKFDINVLSRHGIRVQGLRFDSMVADYLVDTNHPHGLKDLAWDQLGYRMTPISELIGTGAKAITMAKVSIERAAPYAAADAAVSLELVATLESKLREGGLTPLFTDLELPLIEVLAEVEQHGVTVDKGYLAQLSHVFGNRLAELEHEIHALAGTEFNINSPKQLAVILFDKLQLPVLKRTPKKEPSTDASVLEELSSQHEVVAKILEFRQLTKLKGTYVDSLPELVNARTGRIHTSFNQTVAATGRLSSEKPNLQNIPIRTAEGREIRRAFVPSAPDTVIMAADYSQIELRLLAHIAEEPVFIEAFRKDEDIHALTASQIFRVPLEAVTKDQRRMAKTVNFATIYGQGAFSLAKVLGIPMGEAKAFIDAFWDHYPRIRHYTIEAVARVKRRGYAETLLGRRRYIPELNDRRLKDFGERTSVNSPIQGTAADIIKIAMVRLHRALEEGGFSARMILQVHDELVLEVPTAEIEAVGTLVRATMEGAYPELAVPLKVELAVGPSWMEAK